MGVGQVSLTVLAFSSPLTTAWGYLPFVIFFAGTAAPVAFLVAMGLLLIFAVGFVAMSRGIPNPGAFYSFITHGLNKRLGLGAAFLATTAYFVMLTGISCFFGLTASNLVVSFGGPEIAWYWFTVLALVIVGVLGYLGIEFSARTLVLVMLIEIAIVFAFNIASIIDGGPEGRAPEAFSIFGFAEGNIGLGVMYAILMFLGFEGTAIFREEARNPNRTIPRATYLSVAFIGISNAITVWALIVAVGPSNALALSGTDPAGMFPAEFAELLGVVTRDIASIFVLTAIFASTLATHNILTRYMFNQGVDGTLPSKLGRVHPKQRSPHVASLVASSAVFIALAILLIVQIDPSMYYGPAAGVGALCLIILMLITSIAVLRFFRRSKDTDRSKRLWSTRVAPVLAILGLGAIVVLALINVNDFMGTPTALSVTFLVIIACIFVAGIAVASYLRAQRPEVYARIGRQTGDEATLPSPSE